jgi:membrane protein DedA with SNARE-associated domain
MQLIDQLMAWLEQIARSTNLEIFVVLGSFLEEIIAPIPSPFVMTTASGLAQSQQYTLLQLSILILVASAAKTVSSYVIYVAADKAEDIVIGKFGKYVGVSHALIEKIGGFLTGTKWDDVLMVIARALPFVPTVLVSAGCGVIKYNVKSFWITTFLGSILRNIFYLWVGYFGLIQLEHLWEQYKGNPVVLGLLMVGILVMLYAAVKVKDRLFEKMLEMKKKN